MSQTWTEYAVRWDDEPDPDEKYDLQDSREDAERIVRMYPNWRPVLVGRTVTASDWLPVQEQA